MPKKIPDTLVIVFFILVLMTILSWIIPAGNYERTNIGSRTDVVVANSYHAVESSPQGIWQLLQAPFKGFSEASKIIAFVLLVGGAFGIVMSTGAIDAGLHALIRKAGENSRQKKLLLVILIFLFSLCGFTFGMSEESLIFVLFTIPMAQRMNYDAIVGVAIPFVSSGIGGAAAAYNPFSVGVAMEISGIPFPSGVLERTVIWLILTAVVAIFILRYASRLEHSPSKSLMSSLPTPTLENGHPETTKLTMQRIGVLVLFALTLIAIPLGANWLDWGVIEIGSIFLTMGLLSALLARMSVNEVSQKFTEGAMGMLTAALVIALSRSVLVIARDGQIIDSILYYMAKGIDGLPAIVSIQLMFIVQGIINFFIPSGSGQAAITMPVMAPLADLVGISRDSAVMAFQLAAGYFDLIIPTSGVTMGVLSLAGIPYHIWIKWIWKLMALMVILAMLALGLLVSLGF